MARDDKYQSDEKVRPLIAKKLEISQKIQDLRLERARLNAQLLEAGADAAVIAAW